MKNMKRGLFEEYRYKEILKVTNLSIAVLAFFVGLGVFFSVGDKDLTYCALYYSVSSFLLYPFFESIPFKVSSRIYILNWIFITVIMTLLSGGLAGPSAFLFFPVPLLALFLFEDRESFFWISILIICSIFVEYTVWEGGNSKIEKIIFFIAGMLCITFFGLTLRYAKRNEADKFQRELLLASRLSSIGELAAGIGHEINNPLTVSSYNLGKLKTMINDLNEVPETIGKLIHKQEESLKRLSHIVKGLGVIARAEKVEREPFLVDQSIDETFLFLAEVYRGEGITIERNLGTGNVKVLGNRLRFQQIIINLLSNARDSVLEDTKDLKYINVQTSQDKGFIYIEVSDNGIGLLKGQEAKIFENRFTTKEVGKGTGMGLSISKKIVEEMNGEISVRSEEGMGATFIIKIPICTGID